MKLPQAKYLAELWGCPISTARERLMGRRPVTAVLLDELAVAIDLDRGELVSAFAARARRWGADGRRLPSAGPE